MFDVLIYVPIALFVLGLLLARRGTVFLDLLLAVGLLHMAGAIVLLAMGSPVREAAEITLGAGMLAVVVIYAFVGLYPLILAPLALALVALGAAWRWAPALVRGCAGPMSR